MARQMKDSGVEWIGQIPEDWEIVRIKQLFAEVDERCTKGNEYTLLSVSEYYGVSPKKDHLNEDDMLTRAETLDGYKICRKNDIVMNIMLAWKRALGVSEYVGIISPAYCVYRARQEVCAKYFHYLFRTDIYAELFKQNSTGIIDSRLRLYPDKFLALKCQVPPLEQQDKIASYLDCKCAEIDAIIAKQQQIIEKLKEYKLSVITEAVTKGLDPNMPMKDSEVEWIGMVPEEWRISRIKYICEFNPGTKKANHDVVSYAPMECVKDGYLIKKEIRHDGISTGLTSFEEGDIIMAKVTPCFENGNIAIAKDLVNKFGVGSSELFVFRAKKVNTQWLFYFLRNSIFKKLAEATMTGTGGLKRVSPSFIRDFSLALPPEKEQRRIIEYLDKKCMEIDRVIKYKQSAVEKLGQYKKSLIYEVVTGKMEV